MIALLPLLALLLLPGPAWAHANIRGTDPPVGARVAVPPRSVRLLFDEAVVAGVSSLRLLDRSGQKVQEGPLKATDPAHMAAEFALGKLDPGAYTVAWKILSAVDGHVTRGVFAFAYAPPGFEGNVDLLTAPGGGAPGGGGWAWGLRAVQVVAVWAHLLALLTLTGACAIWLVAARPAAPPIPFPPALARTVLWGAGVSIAAAVLSLQLEWLQVSDAPLGQTLQLLVFFPAIPVALGTRSSIAAFIRLALLTGVASLATRLPDRDPLALPGILALGAASLVSVAVASHGAAVSALAGALPDLIHLAAASLWVGGVVLLGCLACGRPPDRAPDPRGVSLREAMRRFTPWAAGSLILLVITGILGGTVEVRTWSALWRTAYGAILTAKVALLLPLLALACLNTLWCRGKLATAIAVPRGTKGLPPRVWSWGERRFRRSDWAVRGEVGLAAIALLCAAALTQLPPPKEGAAGPPPPLSLTGRADGLGLALTLTAPRGMLGASRVALTVSDARGQAPAADARVILRPEMVEREVRILPVTAAPRRDGRYEAELPLSVLGRWDLEVIVRRKGREDATARFALNLGDQGLSPIDPTAPTGTRLSPAAAWIGRASRVELLLGAALGAGGFLLAAAGLRRRRWVEGAGGAGLLALGALALWSAMAVSTTPATFRPNPFRADVQSLRAGRALYDGHCAGCHGSAGLPSPPPAGTRPSAAAAFPDLTGARMGRHTDGDLFWWISRGLPGTAMPAFGQALSDEERWHLVNYIRNLRDAPSTRP